MTKDKESRIEWAKQNLERFFVEGGPYQIEADLASSVMQLLEIIENEND